MTINPYRYGQRLVIPGLSGTVLYMGDAGGGLSDVEIDGVRVKAVTALLQEPPPNDVLRQTPIGGFVVDRVAEEITTLGRKNASGTIVWIDECVDVLAPPEQGSAFHRADGDGELLPAALIVNQDGWSGVQEFGCISRAGRRLTINPTVVAGGVPIQIFEPDGRNAWFFLNTPDAVRAATAILTAAKMMAPAGIDPDGPTQ